MGILVQKFGGTSLSNAEARQHVLEHIKDALSQKYQLVVVVSAMGRKGDPYATDTLLELIKQNGDKLPAREKDLLLSCGELISAANLCSILQAEGIPSVMMTGGQAGIITNEEYGNAQIISMDPIDLIHQLDQGNVVIVTGFQGRTENHQMTTLGRGGSDTTATALGAALHADMVDIFTDVNGILTADPRIVEDAKPLSVVSYTEICNMAHNGAKVIHPRAVEIAMHAKIPVRVRSTFSKETGTLVTHMNAWKADSSQVADRFVTGIAHTMHISQIQVFAEEGQYDLHLRVFKSMAEHGISVDFINVNPSGVVYTVAGSEAERAAELLRELGYSPKCLHDCSKVSVIGGGMNGVPGIMAHIVEALTEQEIQILQCADSNATIWVLVHQQDMVGAVKALHYKFNLHK
jgi:aspartate kinase